MDLNIIIEDSSLDQNRDSDQVILQKIARCKTLGFHTIALSVVIDMTTKNTSTFVIPQPPNVELLTSSNIKILTRLTARVSETLQIYKLSKSKDSSKYDLIALEPQNAKILHYISMGSADLDILTFDLSDRLDYNLFKISYKVLEERGVCMEINYGPAQLGSSLRRNIICNGQNLTEKTTKNILLSSGINDSFRLRSPKDAKSIGILFMMPTSRCHDAVFNNGNKVINLAKHRANPASSAIELIN